MSDSYIIIGGLILIGAVVGSFLNMLIYRLPRDLDTVYKRSHCPSCNHDLDVIALIPVLSFLIQRGKCRYCKSRIPTTYLWVELVSIGVSVGSFLWFGSLLEAFKGMIFFWTMIVLFVTDLRHYYLPDRLTVFLIVLGGIWAVTQNQVADSGIGFLVGGGVYLLILVVGRLIYRKPVMGLGDVKLGAAIGAYWGLQAAIITCYLSFILGGVVGMLLLISKHKKRTDEIPFGPFIIMACVIALLWGEEIRNAFFGTFP